jgi:hypothetical protein
MIDIVEPTPNPLQQAVDVFVGSFGLAGAITVAAILLGAMVGGVLLWLRSRDPLGRS